MKKEELSKEKQKEYDELMDELKIELDKLPELPKAPEGTARLSQASCKDRLEITNRYLDKIRALFEEKHQSE